MALWMPHMESWKLQRAGRQSDEMRVTNEIQSDERKRHGEGDNRIDREERGDRIVVARDLLCCHFQ